MSISSSTTTTSTNKKKPSPFFTTSDLLNTINSSLRNDDDDNNGYFTLQRRLPDGQTTRQATKDEIAAADFQSKLQQAAEMTAHLSPQERIQWSKKLRAEGNILFQEKDYTAAMDIYLTCLVGLNSKDNTDSTPQKELFSEELEKEIKIPILCNLSICALKLKMYKKCIKFCNFALMDTKHGTAYHKLYYLRGKATMLLGENYDTALEDFDKSISLLKETENVGEIEIIEKEKLKLNRLKLTAVENEKKCKDGMKSILGGNVSDKTSDIVAQNENIEKESSNGTKGLYSDRNNDEARSYSTLRSRKKQIASFHPPTSTTANLSKSNEISASVEFIIILLFLTISIYIAISYISDN